jgi:VIT1/CCC1 family predicted Fe2+/Mn2+ transporter
MDSSLRLGFSFGLASGTITTLGLLIGLYYSTGSKLAVIAGILTIAVADAFSDAFGIHVSQESKNRYNDSNVWESTLATLFSKFFFAITFLVPVLLFDLKTAVFVGLVWGLILITFVSFWIAKIHKMNKWKVLIKHLGLAFIVIGLTSLLGKWIAVIFS